MKDFVQNVQEFSARGQDWKYTTLQDSGSGATGNLVPVSSEKYIKLVGFIISTTGAGTLEIKIGENVAIHLEFNERKSEPFTFPFPVLVPPNTAISATFTADSAPATCYVTTIYHYETIE